jgi:hypothetical protein
MKASLVCLPLMMYVVGLAGCSPALAQKSCYEELSFTSDSVSESWQEHKKGSFNDKVCLKSWDDYGPIDSDKCVYERTISIKTDGKTYTIAAADVCGRFLKEWALAPDMVLVVSWFENGIWKDRGGALALTYCSNEAGHCLGTTKASARSGYTWKEPKTKKGKISRTQEDPRDADASYPVGTNYGGGSTYSGAQSYSGGTSYGSGSSRGGSSYGSGGSARGGSKYGGGSSSHGASGYGSGSSSHGSGTTCGSIEAKLELVLSHLQEMENRAVTTHSTLNGIEQTVLALFQGSGATSDCSICEREMKRSEMVNRELARELTMLKDEQGKAGAPTVRQFEHPHTDMRSIVVNGVPFVFRRFMGAKTRIGLPKEKVNELLRTRRQGALTLMEMYPEFEVELKGFWMMTHELSKEQYLAVTDPEKLGQASQKKLKGKASKEDADRFAKLFNKLTSVDARLPTEEEFEYVARRLYKQQEHPVGLPVKSCADISRVDVDGVYGILGGLQEWTSTQYRPYKGNTDAEKRPDHFVVRGGQGGVPGINESKPLECMPQTRFSRVPSASVSFLGFRLVFSGD